jgi:hypothetical protein
MPHITDGAHATGPQQGTLHHAGVELNVTLEVQTGSDSRVEQWLIFEMADGGHCCGEGATADKRPTRRERSLDRRLPLRALGHGHRPSTAVDD